MTYNKKRALSYGGILISVFLAYFCRLVRPENVFMRNLADQCRNCIYLGMYCAWVIYLEKHVVHRKTRRCLTAIGCLMVFWFFVRTVKFHILHDPLGEHICWYLYYNPDDPDPGPWTGSSDVSRGKGWRENSQKNYCLACFCGGFDHQCFYK